MNRFKYALQAASAPHQVSLSQLAQMFSLAVDQTAAEGFDSATDPAVILLGTFIAFQTHADVNTASGYHALLELCNQRLYTLETLQ